MAGVIQKGVQLFVVPVLHIKFENSTQSGFQDTVGTNFSQKGETLWQYFVHCALKLIGISSYGKSTVFQISTPYLEGF